MTSPLAKSRVDRGNSLRVRAAKSALWTALLFALLVLFTVGNWLCQWLFRAFLLVWEAGAHPTEEEEETRWRSIR